MAFLHHWPMGNLLLHILWGHGVSGYHVLVAGGGEEVSYEEKGLSAPTQSLPALLRLQNPWSVQSH